MLRELLRRVKFRELGVPNLTATATLATSELRAYVSDLIADRQRHPTADLISYLLRESPRATGSDRLEVTLNISMLLIDAGTGTTAALLGNALYLLGDNMTQREELLDSPEKVNAAVEEVIRLESPVQHNMRTTTEAIDLYGRHVPAGSRVLLIFGAANRDERRWQNADALDINRPLLPHLGFGHGIHLCLGAPLARLEVTTALSEFLRRFPGYQLRNTRVRLPNLDRGFLSLPALLR
jgi:cytochrome P450